MEGVAAAAGAAPLSLPAIAASDSNSEAEDGLAAAPASLLALPSVLNACSWVRRSASLHMRAPRVGRPADEGP